MNASSFAARNRFPAGLEQPRAGYRFSADALALLNFAAELELEPGAAVADLGAGCGVTGLGLGLRVPGLRLVGVEKNAAMAGCARRNADRLGLGLYRLVQGDVGDPETLAATRQAAGELAAHAGPNCTPPSALAPPAPLFDAVLCNPPWRLTGSGRPPPSPDRREALFGDAAILSVFLRAADALLRPQGSLALVCGAERLADALSALPERLRPVRLRFAYGAPGRDAAFFLLEACRNSRAALRTEAPLLLN